MNAKLAHRNLTSRRAWTLSARKRKAHAIYMPYGSAIPERFEWTARVANYGLAVAWSSRGFFLRTVDTQA